MKKLLILLLIGFANANAQDYFPVNRSASYFKDISSNINGFRVDSIFTDGLDSLFLFSHSWRRDSLGCYYPDGPSWAGYKTLKKANGDCYFFNQNRDSIYFLSNTIMDSEWICYKYSNGDRLFAKIIDWKSQSFLSVTDSTKTISFTRKNSSNVVVTDPINSLQMELSKNYGFIKMPGIKEFPEDITSDSVYALMNPKLGKGFISNRTIYDFNVGDEFHYSKGYYNPPSTWIGYYQHNKKTITSKSISANGDTVTYSVSLIYHLEDINYPSMEKLLDTVIFYSGTEIHFYDAKPYITNEADTKEKQQSRYYTLWEEANGKRSISPSWQEFKYDGFVDSCWKELVYFPTCNRVYKEGCGLSNFDCDIGVGSDYENLVYYKKGNETWGTPLSVMDYSVSTVDRYIIFPNPVSSSDIINISNALSVKEVSVFDLTGRLVYKALNESNSAIRISASQLSKGIFFVKILDKKGSFSAKRLIIE